MPLLFWDASALAKRYVREVGTDTANALFSAVPTTSATALRQEIISSLDFGFLYVDDAAVLASLPLLQRHNLNSMDATLLAVLLCHAQAQPPGTPHYVLVSADRRFVRAAEAEGFTAINPELLPAADVPATLATL